MIRHSWDYDVAVVGGGPAGSAAATALAREGHRVLVVERDVFPRFHIGESLLPLSGEVFRRLGVTELVKSAGFVEKRGATFLSASGDDSVRIDFSTSDEVPDPVTCHVPRAEFDALLLGHAERCGAEVLQGVRVRGAEFDPDRVRLEIEEDGGSRTVSARFLVDASGRYGFLAKRLDLRVPDEELRKVALFAHFEGVEREAGIVEGDIQVITTDDLGWWWFIPLPDGRTSAGYVFDREHDPRNGRDLEGAFDEAIRRSPVVGRQLTRATRVSEIRCEADYSYTTRAYGGERFLLVGDAGSFLDPVFSTGVELALCSGLEAGESISSALRRGRVLSGAPLRRFERRQRSRYRFFRRFVTKFYTPAFRSLLFEADRWPRTTLAIVGALAGNDRMGLSSRFLLSWFFLGVAQRERRARREEASVQSEDQGRRGASQPAATRTVT